MSWICYGTGFQIIVMCLCHSRRLLPWNDRSVRPRVPQLSHLVGGGLNSFPSREEASSHGRSSYLPVAEVLFKGLWQCGFLPHFKCGLRHPEEETASPLPCGAFSLRCAEEELALGPIFPDKFSFLCFVCGGCSICRS